jgi:hypothetical protein
MSKNKGIIERFFDALEPETAKNLFNVLDFEAKPQEIVFYVGLQSEKLFRFLETHKKYPTMNGLNIKPTFYKNYVKWAKQGSKLQNGFRDLPIGSFLDLFLEIRSTMFTKAGYILADASTSNPSNKDYLESKPFKGLVICQERDFNDNLGYFVLNKETEEKRRIFNFHFDSKFHWDTAIIIAQMLSKT